MSDELVLIDSNLLAATMRENKIFSIYTEDGDFKNIPWLNVINPLERE